MSKKYKWLIIIFVAYGCLFGCFMLFRTHKKEVNATVFWDNYINIRYENGNWYRISQSGMKSYDWKKYDLYLNDEFLGNYYLMNNKKLYIFDDDKKPIQWKVGTVAFGGNVKSKVSKISTSKISDVDYTYINEVCKSLKVKNVDFSKIINQYKYLVDIDGDKELDTIYSISNAQMEGAYPSKQTFTIVFLRKNNKNIIIYKSIENKSNYFSGFAADMIVFTMENDKKPKILMNFSTYSSAIIEGALYEFNEKEERFDKLIGTYYGG